MKVLAQCVMMLFSSVVMAVTYDVPVPADLSDQARWNLSEASAKIEGDQLKVHYRLPVDLVGATAHAFDFTGTIKSSFVPVSGVGVHGVCMLSESKPAACTLKYPRLQIDDESRDRELAKNFNGPVLDLRKRTVRLFKDDPAGLLIVPVQ